MVTVPMVARPTNPTLNGADMLDFMALPLGMPGCYL
jgi:hypothetical protein